VKETPIKSRSRKAMHYRGVECLNCGHPLDLTDRYCAYCGQLNTTKRLTLKDFFNEFVLSVFTYDSRFRHTLKDLLFKPGTITRYYVEGKRFHYANPFRFFLSASIFYFLLIGLFSFFDGEANQQRDLNFFNSGQAIEEEKLDVILQDSIITQLENVPIINGGIGEVIDNAKNEAIKQNREKLRQDSIQAATGVNYKYIAEKDVDTLFAPMAFSKKLELFQKFRRQTDIIDIDKALDSLHYSKSKTNIWLYGKTEAIDRIEKNPLRFVNYLSSKIPFFLFFFSPLFALVFWLIYSRKRANYMEHLVFIFHIFSWIFVVLLVSLIPDKLLPTENLVASLLLMLIGPFYFYKALRNFYEQSRVITIIKFVLLNIAFLIGTSLFALIFFALTATFY